MVCPRRVSVGSLLSRETDETVGAPCPWYLKGVLCGDFGHSITIRKYKRSALSSHTHMLEPVLGNMVFYCVLVGIVLYCVLCLRYTRTLLQSRRPSSARAQTKGGFLLISLASSAHPLPSPLTAASPSHPSKLERIKMPQYDPETIGWGSHYDILIRSGLAAS